MSAHWQHLVARSARLVVLSLSVIVATLAPLTEVSANGPHTRPEELFSGSVGPYTIRVEAIPIVGPVHMTVVVFDAVSHFPVSDATIKVTGRGSESGIQAGPVLGTYIAGSQTYTMTLPAEEPGDWVFTMVVTSTLGEEVLDMPVVLVRGESGVGWTVIGTAVVLIGLLLWFAGRALRKGKQRMSPRPQGRKER